MQKQSAETAKRSRGANVFVAVVLALGLVVGAGSAIWIKDTFLTPRESGTKSETTRTELIQSITREEQVVLVSLGIQGIAQKKDISVIFGADVPWSDRTTFLQYNFSAKLGIDDKGIDVRKIGANKFLVSIPQFIFIGHDNEEFTLIAENNGVLSFVTPEIDKVDMINKILNSEAKTKYILANEEILRDQATAFYTSLINSIDPTVALEFEFRN
ncbi:MAG: hypothetical protein ABIW32_04030 [Terrimesophilobacter sp.]